MMQPKAEPKAAGAKPRKPMPRTCAETLKLITIEGERLDRRISPARREKMEELAEQAQPGNKIGLVRGQSPKGEDGLTEKQRSFADGIAKGLSLSASYRASYDTANMKTESVNRRASELADNVNVAARVKLKLKEMEASEPHDDASIRRKVKQYLLDTLADPKVKPSDRTKAAELLGKMTTVALFSETSTVKVENLSDSEAEARLAALLHTLAPSQPTEDKD